MLFNAYSTTAETSPPWCFLRVTRSFARPKRGWPSASRRKQEAECVYWFRPRIKGGAMGDSLGESSQALPLEGLRKIRHRTCKIYGIFSPGRKLIPIAFCSSPKSQEENRASSVKGV